LDGLIRGCYVHGLFADDRFRTGFLADLGATGSDYAYEADVEATLNALAAHMAAHVDLDRLLRLAR
jgi:adenosylcobyric acid synthase